MALWQTITSARGELLQKLSQRLRSREHEDSRDPIPEIHGLLDHLVTVLHFVDKGRHPTLLPAGKVLAGSVGEIGAVEGRDIDEVVNDFLAMHDCILELSQERNEIVTLAEHRALARGINRAIAEAAVRYGHARDREVQRAHAEHFAFLAHELRGPLSNIKLGVELIDEGIDLQTLAPRLRRSADTMREMLDNEITRARLSSVSPMKAESMRLTEIIDEVVDDLRMQADDRGIELSVDAPDPLELQADPRLLRSVLTNLLTNAIKFSRRGRAITIRGRREGDEIVCEVSDSCGGLPEDRVGSLFVPYRQAGQDRSGFGLGLAIVADAVALHDGTIEAVNRPDEGCTMVMRLPCARPST